VDLEAARAALPDFDVAAIDQLAGGSNSAVYDVLIGIGERVVLKVYSELLRWKLRKEVLVYGLLERHQVDVPAPRVLHADDSKRMLVLTKLDGELLEPLAASLSEDERVRIAREVGELLARLHRMRFDEFGYVGVDGIVDPHPSNLDYMSFQFEKSLREFPTLGGDEELARRLDRHVEARRDLLATCEGAVFCHDDCHSGNLLVVPGDGGWRISGVLDFENVVAGDPLLDLAKAHCYDRHASERTLAALVDGYRGLRAGWRETLDFYVVYHWLELWVWWASTGTTEPLAGLEDELRRLSLD